MSAQAADQWSDLARAAAQEADHIVPVAESRPPRLVHEALPQYTEEARRRGISGDVLLEVVVLRSGAVGDIRILQRLGGGLDEETLRAVRQWRFAPADRFGTPVDVVVEVAVEFKLR